MIFYIFFNSSNLVSNIMRAHVNLVGWRQLVKKTMTVGGLDENLTEAGLYPRLSRELCGSQDKWRWRIFCSGHPLRMTEHQKIDCYNIKIFNFTLSISYLSIALAISCDGNCANMDVTLLPYIIIYLRIFFSTAWGILPLIDEITS